MLFKDLDLIPELLRSVQKQGYKKPTPIQKQAIPQVLAGQDVMARAQTGTGKTAAFALPLLQRLHSANHSALRKSGRPRALVLAPTRELAAQVGESFKNYGKAVKLRTTVIFGGVGANPQIQALRQGVDILVATPGRLLDLLQQEHLKLDAVEYFVLDEADRMLDMGFIRDIHKIIRYLPRERQSLMFSATYSKEIKTLAKKLLKAPKEIEIAQENSTADTVKQSLFRVERPKKRKLLSQLIQDKQWPQVLVFTRTKHGANRLAKQLNQDGIPATAIHGNKSQTARTRALDEFKKRKVQTLVATDIAARGIDIEYLPCVVNYDLPHVPEDYVHRIGRTGRANKRGVAVSLVSEEELKLLRGIERLIGRKIPTKTS